MVSSVAQLPVTGWVSTELMLLFGESLCGKVPATHANYYVCPALRSPSQFSSRRQAVPQCAGMFVVGGWQLVLPSYFRWHRDGAATVVTAL